MSEQRWLPLESNPDVLNKYAYGLGMPQSWEFVDIYGLDPDLLAMVPEPVKAVVLLYPTTEKSEASAIGSVKVSDKLYHIKQTIGNACGTIAMVHTLANSADQIQFEDGKPFQKFLESTLDMTPSERATYLENDKGMGSAHEDIAQEGQTQAPSRDDKVSTHFVALINKDEELYELDGRKDGPVLHGSSSDDTLLKDAVQVVKKFMARDPDELNFTLMALVRKGQRAREVTLGVEVYETIPMTDHVDTQNQYQARVSLSLQPMGTALCQLLDKPNSSACDVSTLSELAKLRLEFSPYDKGCSFV